METYKITYYTDLMTCCYQQVGGSFYLELSEEEVACLERFVQDVFGDFDLDTDAKILTKELKEKLQEMIDEDFNYNMALEALYSISYCDLYDPSVTEQEWDEMSQGEKVNYLMENCSCDDGGYNSVRITQLEYQQSSSYKGSVS